jgi:hypothetical protein
MSYFAARCVVLFESPLGISFWEVITREYIDTICEVIKMYR